MSRTIRVGEGDLSIDRDGAHHVLWRKKSRLAGLEPWIHTKAREDHARKIALELLDSRIEQASNSLGCYGEAVSMYTLQGRNVPEEKNTITARTRLYENGLVYLEVEAPKEFELDSEALGGIRSYVPTFKRGTLFAGEPRQTIPLRGKGPFPNEINRVINIRLDRLEGDIKGCFFIWEDEDSLLQMAVPLNLNGLRGWVSAGNEQLVLGCSSFDITHQPTSMPLCVIGLDEDLYKLAETTYRSALKLMNWPTYHRKEKPYPEVFKYLGWCSWEGFKENIDEEVLLRSARYFCEEGVPVKYLLIDAGWQSVKERKLCSFEANQKKFPRDLKGLIDEAKGRYGISSLGVWFTLQGYWEGVHPDSDLANKYKESLLRGTDGQYIPSPLNYKAFNFYHDLCCHLRTQGVDFVKVDNQTDIVEAVRNQIPLDEAGGNLLHSLQAAVNLHFKGMINCMAMGLHCAYHWIASNVTRASEDYRAHDKERAKVHIMHSIFNALWLSQLVYPDYDMFHSKDRYALCHAVSRAISGGPVYISDVPWKGLNNELISRLCLEDGQLLRPDEPALPCRDTIFSDPYAKPNPLKAFTHVGSPGIVAAFNICKDGVPIEVQVGPVDLPIQLRAKGDYFTYSSVSGRWCRIGRSETVKFRLEELEAEIVILSPIKDGFASIGLLEKFIAPAGVEQIVRENSTIRIMLKEAGTFGAYLQTRGEFTVLVNGRLIRQGKNLSSDTFTYEDGFLRVSAKEEDKIRYNRSKKATIEIRFAQLQNLDTELTSIKR